MYHTQASLDSLESTFFREFLETLTGGGYQAPSSVALAGPLLRREAAACDAALADALKSCKAAHVQARGIADCTHTPEFSVTVTAGSETHFLGAIPNDCAPLDAAYYSARLREVLSSVEASGRRVSTLLLDNLDVYSATAGMLKVWSNKMCAPPPPRRALSVCVVFTRGWRR